MFAIGEWILERNPKIIKFSVNNTNPNKIDITLYEKHSLDYLYKYKGRIDFDKELKNGV
jgi:hypothetical protein